MKIQITLEVHDARADREMTLDQFLVSPEVSVLQHTLNTTKINCHTFKVLDIKAINETENMIPIEFNGEYADDHMTIDQFCQCVADGLFNDYDGGGAFATATHYNHAYRVIPSNVYTWCEDADEYYITRGKLLIEKPEWATHIVWFNK